MVLAVLSPDNFWSKYVILLIDNDTNLFENQLWILICTLAQKECIHFYQDVEKMKVIHMHWRMCQ
jgi:hypothetical protein